MKRLLLSALALVAVSSLLVGCSDGDSESSGKKVDGPTLEVELTDAGCSPQKLTAAPGPTNFHVTNRDASAVDEFYLLTDKKDVLAEVEGVAAGLDRTMSYELKTGSYLIRCPGADDEFGTLEVTAAETDPGTSTTAG